MRAAPDQKSSYASGGSLPWRIVALAIALGFNLLLVLMLLRLAGVVPAPAEMSRMVVFGVRSEQPSREKQERKATKAERKAASTAAAAPPAAAMPRAERTPMATATPFSWSDLGVMQLERKDYAASDVGRITPHPNAKPGQGDGEAGGSDEGDSQRAGTGPNGEALYAAEWYREPTDAELSPYVAGRAQPGGWAEIACRTVPRFHVDDCIELGDYPQGSRLAGAIRQAAFQFLVRPPRVGGKTLVGSWVRIRITFSDRAHVR